jgi:FtsP/CotA-like multicopper oxidase with cupredoxin domain
MRSATLVIRPKIVVLAAALLGALALAGNGQAAARGVVCTNGTTFNLQTTTGHVVTPDGNSVYMWSYAPDPGSFQAPGPTLCVTAGSTVTVHLKNNLLESASIVFPGQEDVTAAGDADGLFTKEAAANGGEATYSFVASRPGTYIYQSGTDVTKQVEMGLYGALIVRPAGHPDWAYNDASTQFDPSREYLQLLHDLDPFLHAAVERGQPFRITTRRDRYFTINGRSFPDTIADNGVSWLASQPYGALVEITPSTPGAKSGLIRYANAGLSNHPMHPHGNHLRVIARDGTLLRGPAGQDTSYEDFTRTIGSGQTYDSLLRWTNAESYSPANPVPVALPSYRSLMFKDGRTWYSGSPYLGYKGTLPAGTTSNNQCGEYYFPLHSHALNEFTNFDEGFGGMATLLRVDPPGGCP